jgi:hypothetical protein
MKTFRKYQFGSKGAATTKINALPHDEEGNPAHSHAIVHLGNLVVTPAVYDEEGNEVTPPVMTSTYHIDVLWDGEPDASWDNQLVWCPPMGVHVFGSSSAIAEWVEKCKELHPEYFPEPDTDIIE